MAIVAVSISPVGEGVSVGDHVARAIRVLEGQDRIRFEGHDALLPPELSFDLGLIVHELLTNSLKYGALGTDHAEVALKWSMTPSPDGHRDLHQTHSVRLVQAHRYHNHRR